MPVIRPPAACGPERDERPGRAGPRWSSSGRGSRVPSRDGASSAGRSASSGVVSSSCLSGLRIESPRDSERHANAPGARAPGASTPGDYRNRRSGVSKPARRDRARRPCRRTADSAPARSALFGIGVRVRPRYSRGVCGESGPNRLAGPSGAVLPCGGPRRRDARGRPRGTPRGGPGGRLPSAPGAACSRVRPRSLVVTHGTSVIVHLHPAPRRRADRVLMDAKHIWRAALGELQVALSPANFETWLRHTSLVDVDDTRFRIAVPNGFAKDWLETRYRPLISQTLARIVGYSVQVEFVVREDAGAAGRAPPAAPRPAGARRADARRRRRAGLEPQRRGTRSPTSSSARPTGSPTPPPSRSPSAPATPTTRSSCTAAWASARRT